MVHMGKQEKIKMEKNNMLDKAKNGQERGGPKNFEWREIAQSKLKIEQRKA